MAFCSDLVVSLCLLSRVECNIAEFAVQWFTKFPQAQGVLLILCTQWRVFILGLLAQ